MQSFTKIICFDSTDLQYYSACVLTGIVCGTSEQTKAVVDAGGAVKLINLLGSTEPHIVEQAVLALGSMASDCHEIRDCLVDLGTVGNLTKLASSQV